MGNITKKEPTIDDATLSKTYSKIINMGFRDDICIEAATKHPDNVEKAINYILKHQTKDNDNIRQSESKANDKKQKHDENTIYFMDCKDIKQCQPMNQLIALLKYYKQCKTAQSVENEEISLYFETNKFEIINNYHHILQKHLNEDNAAIDTLRSDETFKIIHNMIMDKNNDLKCDIKTCPIYLRHHRQREQDKHNEFAADFLDTIHCYFVHSVDVGYRILNDSKSKENDNDNGIINMYHDTELVELKSYLQKKRKTVEAIRGSARIQHNKFLSSFTPNIYQQKVEKKEDEGKQAMNTRQLQCICGQELLLKKQTTLYEKERINIKSPYIMCDLCKTKTKITKCTNSSLSFYHCINEDSPLHPSGFDVCLPCIEDMKCNAMNSSDVLKSNENDIRYSFGLRYDYWSLQKNGRTVDVSDMKPKYVSLSEEVVTNNIHRIEKTAFNNATQKAQNLLETSVEIKAMKCRFAHSAKYYNIDKDAPLSIYHILAVVLYTDFDTLSYKFSETFRKINPLEQSTQSAARNMEYGNWAKYLMETVNCYGTTTNDSNINVFYHGVSFMHFQTFMSTFNCPLSTTTKLQVAAVFARNDGLILELFARDAGLRYFNCSFFSYFANEDERLFIAPPYCYGQYLQIVNIRYLAMDESYKSFIYILSMLHQILTDVYGARIECNEISTKSDVICCMNEYMDSLCEFKGISKSYSKYIAMTLQKWANSITEISVNIELINKKAADLLIRGISPNNLLDYPKFNMMCKRLQSVQCGSVGIVGVSYLNALLSMLRSIKKMDYSQLQTIHLYGVDTKYSSAEFVKYQSLFHQNGWKMEEKHIKKEEYKIIFQNSK